MKNTDRIKTGFVINGRFEIVDKLGEGGFAVVFEGRDLSLDRQVAIKVLHGALLGTDSERNDRAQNVLERFEREAKLAATVEHDSIVKIHDVGEIEGIDEPFIVMEYLRGVSLQDFLDERGAMPASKLIPLYQRLLVGLGFAHEAGIVHKDLKPDNIFYRYPDTIRESFCVVDFGIAHIGRNNSQRVTRNGEFFGTPSYMAPEYITDQSVSPALDVYQAGLILLECLMGEPFLFHEDAMANLLMHLNRTKLLPEPLMKSGLGAIIERTIAQDPLDRYPDAMAFAEALATVDPASIPGKDVLATAPSPSSSRPTAMGTVPGHAPTGLDEDSEVAAMAWTSEDAGLVNATTAAHERASPSTQFIDEDVVVGLNEASDVYEEFIEDNRRRREGSESPGVGAATVPFDSNADARAKQPEPEPEPTPEPAPAPAPAPEKQRTTPPSMDETLFVDFAEPPEDARGKRSAAIAIGVLGCAIAVAAIAAIVLVMNNSPESQAPDPNTSTASLESHTGAVARKSEVSKSAVEAAPEKEDAAVTTPPTSDPPEPLAVEVVSTPAAEIFDGETRLGETPFSLEFGTRAPGRTLTLRREGFEDAIVTISARNAPRFEYTLSAIEAKPDRAPKKKPARLAREKKPTPPPAEEEKVEATPPAEKTKTKLVLPGQRKPEKKDNRLVLPK